MENSNHFFSIYFISKQKILLLSFYTFPLSKCRLFVEISTDLLRMVMDGKPGSSYATICESYQTLLVTPPTSQTLHYSMDWAVILCS